MDVTLTAAIIVKDEERCIARCINSVLTIFNEIIIIDTGSTDNTLSILKSYQSKKIKIFESLWNDDFSSARNFAISKCTGQYILFIDADEYLSSIKNGVLAEDKKAEFDDEFVYCPEIKGHDGNSSKTVRRFFANNGNFYFHGYVHEELRRKDGNEIKDTPINIVINHDGYKDEIIKEKDKTNRNRALNIKNLKNEPNYLRWVFFYFRDSFEILNPNDIYQSLLCSIKLHQDSDVNINNLKSDRYTFPILDLMARAKLKSMDSEVEFYLIINLMRGIIPGNSNATYYELIYDIFKWKITAKNNINKIINLKSKGNQNHSEMIHSEGLHIDAALSFYLYETGLISQARKLLLSVESNGFSSEMTKLYLKNADLINGERNK